MRWFLFFTGPVHYNVIYRSCKRDDVESLYILREKGSTSVVYTGITSGFDGPS